MLKPKMPFTVNLDFEIYKKLAKEMEKTGKTRIQIVSEILDRELR